MSEDRPLRYDQRPIDHTPVRTADLPATPTRDRNIPATAWVDAPTSLLTLGDDLPDRPVAEYKRRLGPWLLWRAGPANHGDARYMALRADDLTDQWTLRLAPDGSADGVAPGGSHHTRFRTWKQALIGHAPHQVVSATPPRREFGRGVGTVTYLGDFEFTDEIDEMLAEPVEPDT
jgi:hypothetical protein